MNRSISRQPLVVMVEGIIAAGKSTLLNKMRTNLLKHQFRVAIAAEPIQAWEDVSKAPADNIHLALDLFSESTRANVHHANGGPTTSDPMQFNLLSQMYANPQRWCFSFQLWALYTRILSIEQAIENLAAARHNDNNDKHSDMFDCRDVLLVERSAYANQIFASIMYESGYLNDCEWQMYNYFFEYFARKNGPPMNGVIFMDCGVDTAIDRIQNRNRDGEGAITSQYMQSLQDKHRQWIDYIDAHSVCDLHRIEIPSTATAAAAASDCIAGDGDVLTSEVISDIADFLSRIAHKMDAAHLHAHNGMAATTQYDQQTEYQLLRNRTDTIQIPVAK